MSSTGTTTRHDATAHDLLRAAHESSYRFPADFGGFSADLAFRCNGERITGSVVVRSPRDISLAGVNDEAAAQWVNRELASMAGHRWPVPYENADGCWTLETGPDDDDPRGQLIRVLDDPYDSSYRVLGGKIREVARSMGPMQFVITIQEHEELTGGLVLPSAFSVTYWHKEQGRLTRADAYTDRYAAVGETWLPAMRRVVTSDDSGISAREFALTNHQLLEGTAPAFVHEAERAGTRAN